MGLVKLAVQTIGAFGSAVNATGANMWTEYFESGDMSGGILMKRGEKIVTKGSRNRGDDNIISSGSGIDVQENQCMILVENGQILDFCAEAGRYTFDASTAPSLLTGSNKGLRALFNEVSNRFAAGGSRHNTQRVYYINLGEVQGFKWGSGNIVFDHWEHDLMTGRPIWHIASNLMGNGTYSIQVTDPAKFFGVIGAQKTGGDNNGLIRREDIEGQIKTEAIAAIRQGVGQLSQLHIGYTDIAAHEFDLTKNVAATLNDSWNQMRGIGIFQIAIGMMDIDDKSREKIANFQETKGYSDPSMLGTYMGMGQTQAMKSAALNARGAVHGFAGLNMTGANGGANIADLMQQGQEKAAQDTAAYQQSQAASQQAPSAATEGEWICSCGQKNAGNFCTNCGSKRPERVMKHCPNCGNAFDDPSHPPKFCPNCGTKLS